MCPLGAALRGFCPRSGESERICAAKRPPVTMSEFQIYERGTEMERTFIMVKPDGVQRGLIGEIVSRFERKGMKMVGGKMLLVPRSLAEQHYAEHRERAFFSELVEFITSSPVFAMVWEGTNAIATARTMIGKTNPADAAPGTMRGDLAQSVGMNLIHGSDSPDSAAREIALWFKPEEITPFEQTISCWI